MQTVVLSTVAWDSGMNRTRWAWWVKYCRSLKLNRCEKFQRNTWTGIGSQREYQSTASDYMLQMAALAHSLLTERGRWAGSSVQRLRLCFLSIKVNHVFMARHGDLVKGKSGWEKDFVTPLLNRTDTKSPQRLDWFLFAMQKCSSRNLCKAIWFETTEIMQPPSRLPIAWECLLETLPLS